MGAILTVPHLLNANKARGEKVSGPSPFGLHSGCISKAPHESLVKLLDHSVYRTFHSPQHLLQTP